MQNYALIKDFTKYCINLKIIKQPLLCIFIQYNLLQIVVFILIILLYISFCELILLVLLCFSLIPHVITQIARNSCVRNILMCLILWACHRNMQSNCIDFLTLQLLPTITAITSCPKIDLRMFVSSLIIFLVKVRLNPQFYSTTIPKNLFQKKVADYVYLLTIGYSMIIQ